MNSPDPSLHPLPPGNRKKPGRRLWISVLVPPLVCLILPFATVPFYEPEPGYNFLGPAGDFLQVAVIAVPITLVICWVVFAFSLHAFCRGLQFGLLVSIGYPIAQAAMCLALAGIGCAVTS